MKAFIIDVAACNGCYSCQISCKDEHVGNDWTPYAKPQPNTGQFWGKVNEYVRGNCPQVKMSYVFVPCQHCQNAPCISACAVEAIYTREDGLVIIDPIKCTGCKNCVDACPYGVIFLNETLEIAQKCTGCAHLLEKYGWKEPRCVDSCPHENCLKFGEESELDMAGAETLNPEFDLTTRVHYKNLPKKFIAGCVYDSQTEEVAVGATCTLTGEGDTFTATTDHWGDFWFNGLKDNGTYSLSINANGKTATVENISTASDVGLGDIALS